MNNHYVRSDVTLVCWYITISSTLGEFLNRRSELELALVPLILSLLLRTT